MSSATQEERIELLLTSQEALAHRLQELVAVFQAAAGTAQGGETIEAVLRDHFPDVLDQNPNILTYDMKFRPTQGESAAATAVLLAATRALEAVVGSPAPHQ